MWGLLQYLTMSPEDASWDDLSQHHHINMVSPSDSSITRNDLKVWYYLLRVATCWAYRGGLPGILTCGVGVGLGWGCNHVSWICTHAVCYATATLVCELSVFLCNHGTLLVCSCVHMVRCWCVMWGGVGVGVGMQSRFLNLHTCCMLRHGNVGVWTFGVFM